MIPGHKAELAEGETVVLQALRRWIAGSRCKDPRLWSLAWNDLAVALGSEPGRDALTALIAMVREICGHARRPLEYHLPCCPCVCADEACILALVGACQRREPEAAFGLAEWLVLRDGIPGLLDAAGRLAAVLSAQGCTLPSRPTLARQGQGASEVRRPAEATLH